MNASTFTTRVVAGTGADLHGAIVAGISALSGPLHGGANEAAMKLFAKFGSAERTPDEVRGMLERKEKLYGFGHPLYRAYDPRAIILKRISHEFSEDAGDPNWYAITEAAEPSSAISWFPTGGWFVSIAESTACAASAILIRARSF